MSGRELRKRNKSPNSNKTSRKRRKTRSKREKTSVVLLSRSFARMRSTAASKWTMKKSERRQMQQQYGIS